MSINKVVVVVLSGTLLVEDVGRSMTLCGRSIIIGDRFAEISGVRGIRGVRDVSGAVDVVGRVFGMLVGKMCLIEDVGTATRVGCGLISNYVIFVDRGLR